jgi:hypothetical protein
MASPYATAIDVTIGSTSVASFNLSCTSADPQVAATNGSFTPTSPPATPASSTTAAANFTG